MFSPDQIPDDSIAAIREHLKVEFELDETDINEMVADYLLNVGRLLGEAKAASDMLALKRIGHAIKGVASNLGSHSVSASGKFIEDNAAPGVSKDFFQSAINSIGRQYEALKAENDGK